MKNISQLMSASCGRRGCNPTYLLQDSQHHCVQVTPYTKSCGVNGYITLATVTPKF